MRGGGGSGYKVYSVAPKPKLIEEEAHVQLVLKNQRTILDTLTNMLCATCKPLDTPIECLVENVLYKAGNELYVIGGARRDMLKPHGDIKINIDGWADINLEQFLNMGFREPGKKENLTIVY